MHDELNDIHERVPVRLQQRRQGPGQEQCQDEAANQVPGRDVFYF